MKTKIVQFLPMIQSDSAGGHRHGQTTKSDMMFMTDLAGRYADSGSIVDTHCAGLADSA